MSWKIRARRSKIDFLDVELREGPRVGIPFEIFDAQGTKLMSTVPTRVLYGHPDDDPARPATWTTPDVCFWSEWHGLSEMWRLGPA